MTSAARDSRPYAGVQTEQRVQAHRVTSDHRLEVHEGIPEREAGVDRVARRAVIAALESKRGREQGAKAAEVRCGGRPFDAEQAGDAPSGLVRNSIKQRLDLRDGPSQRSPVRSVHEAGGCAFVFAAQRPRPLRSRSGQASTARDHVVVGPPRDGLPAAQRQHAGAGLGRAPSTEIAARGLAGRGVRVAPAAPSPGARSARGTPEPRRRPGARCPCDRRTGSSWGRFSAGCRRHAALLSPRRRNPGRRPGSRYRAASAVHALRSEGAPTDPRPRQGLHAHRPAAPRAPMV